LRPTGPPFFSNSRAAVTCAFSRSISSRISALAASSAASACSRSGSTSEPPSITKRNLAGKRAVISATSATGRLDLDRSASRSCRSAPATPGESARPRPRASPSGRRAPAQPIHDLAVTRGALASCLRFAKIDDAADGEKRIERSGSGSMTSRSCSRSARTAARAPWLITVSKPILAGTDTERHLHVATRKVRRRELATSFSRRSSACRQAQADIQPLAVDRAQFPCPAPAVRRSPRAAQIQSWTAKLSPCPVSIPRRRRRLGTF
jgi:hypothetical protein